MKELILLTVIIFSLNTNAQTEKGSFFISGLSNVNFTLNRNYSYNEVQGLNGSNTQHTRVQVAFSGGYFVLNNFSIGLGISGLREKRFMGSFFDQKPADYLNQAIAIGPELSYLFLPESRWRPFVSTSVLHGWQKVHLGHTGVTGTGRDLHIGVNAGLAYFINEKWSINGGIHSSGSWYFSGKSSSGNESFWKTNFRSLNFSGAFGMTFFF